MNAYDMELMLRESVQLVEDFEDALESCQRDLAELEQRNRLLESRLMAANDKLEEFEQAHRDHLTTGDYGTLGMAVQDIIRKHQIMHKPGYRGDEV